MYVCEDWGGGGESVNKRETFSVRKPMKVSGLLAFNFFSLQKLFVLFLFCSKENMNRLEFVSPFQVMHL